MVNYMKSECYRLLHKKGLYLTSLLCFLLIAAAAAALAYFKEHEPGFPYATTGFFYSNVIGSGWLVIVIGTLFNFALTGKDLSVVKQTVSFGISRSMIFWGKLILTLAYFLLICSAGVIFMIALGENLLESNPQSVQTFLMACVNMAPLVLSGFFLSHTLKMLKVGEVYITIVVILMFGFLSNLLRLLRAFPGLNELYKYVPDTLFNKNLTYFMDGSVPFSYQNWVIGLGISIIALLIGAKRFANQNID